MIKTITFITVAALMGLLIQATLVHSIYPAAVAPDFILVIVVYLSLTRRNVWGLIGAFFLGVLADFASGQFIGPNAAGSVIAFYVSAIVAEKIYADRGLAVVILSFIASLAKTLTVAAMLAIYLHIDFLGWKVLRVVIYEALLSALIAPILLGLFRPGKKGAGKQSASDTLKW